MIAGKNSYNDILIPEELDDIYTLAVKKAKVDLRRKQRQKYAMAAAACLATILLCNNNYVYAKTADIPVIGSFVRLLHVGGGWNNNRRCTGEVYSGKKCAQYTIQVR